MRHIPRQGNGSFSTFLTTILPHERKIFRCGSRSIGLTFQLFRLAAFLPTNRISKVYFADKTDPSITLSAQSLTPLGFFAFRPISFSLRPFSSYARLGTYHRDLLCPKSGTFLLLLIVKAKLYIFFRLLENFYWSIG